MEIFSYSKRVWRSKIVISALLMGVGIFCLQSLHALAIGETQITEREREIRNASTTALYISLATLNQPVTASSITRTVHTFIRQHKQMIGATLLDAQGELFAQLGSGNEDLSTHAFNDQSARIPIQSGGELFGHVVIAFQTSKQQHDRVFQHFSVTMLALVLLFLLAGIYNLYCHRTR